MAEKQQTEDLEKYRKLIDDLDRRLIQTLSERHRVVREVFSKKIADQDQIRDTGREEKLLQKVRSMAVESGLDPYFAEQLFRDIILQSVRYQTNSLVDHQNDRLAVTSITVAYQGTRGAYSHQAALHHFSERYDEVNCVGYKSFKEAVDAVENNEADVALLPIENTTAGSINDTYDLLGERDLHIIGEEVLRVNHCLMAVEPVSLDNIRRILSHPQAISQCSNFLAELPRCKVESYTDTAMAAQKVREDADLSQAAIAGAYAAELFDLHIITKDLENQPGNFTRFVVVAKEPVVCDPQLPCKTSMLLATVHEKGALIKCLNVLGDHGVNMTKLESRPRIGKPWQYLFYLDIEGNQYDPEIKKALREIENKAAYFKILGTYPSRRSD